MDYYEKEREKNLELGRTRGNRAMTMQKGYYNFQEVMLNMKKRRERLLQLNKKIKKDTGKK